MDVPLQTSSGTQTMGLWYPGGQNVPWEHTRHSAFRLVETFPNWHIEHVAGEVCPLRWEKYPSLHRVHEVSLAAPITEENVPGPHKKQVVPQPDKFM
jgi:hypothetical protein